MELEIKDLQVAYGQHVVLNEFSLRVGEGEVLAIVGHNGAGKTTTLKAITGLVRPARGTIVCGCSDITQKSTREITTKCGIRMLPADYRGVFSTRSVLDNLKVAAPMDLYSDKEQLSATIEFCLEIFPALRKKLHDPAGSLSGGQQQMVAMSIALMGKPRLMLLDEPSIGLQPNIVADMLGSVRKLADETGLSVIIVEQNAKVALSIADRVCALRTGKIVRESPAKDVDIDELWNWF